MPDTDPEARAHALRLRELDIEQMKAEAAMRASGAEKRSKVSVAGISVISAAVGGIASLAAAFVSGNFTVQKATLDNAATVRLEQQQFSFDLIQNALAEADQAEQIRRLRFMARIGLLPTLDRAAIEEIAAEAELYRDTAGAEGVALPSYSPPQLRLMGRIQSALNARGDCTPPLLVDGASGLATEACVAAYLGNDKDSFAAASVLLSQSPDVLMAWLLDGDAPPDWRDRLARAGGGPSKGALQEQRLTPEPEGAERVPPAAPGAIRPLSLEPRAPFIQVD